MSKSAEPEIVSLTHEDVEGLKKRVTENRLTEPDQKILVSILSVYFWLQTQLSRAQITILRLKKIFGLPTEKNERKK